MPGIVILIIFIWIMLAVGAIWLGVLVSHRALRRSLPPSAKPPVYDRHQHCLLEIDRLERELVMGRYADERFEAEMRKVEASVRLKAAENLQLDSARQQASEAAQSEQYWRDYAASVWAQQGYRVRR